ncbi:MAG: urease accessory protein UreD [Nitrospinota bacterium]|nr:urease accessory protein UreD [Nitrospinota bacterium]
MSGSTPMMLHNQKIENKMVGKHGIVDVRFEKTLNKTVLRNEFSRIPLKIIKPFYPEEDGTAYLTIISPTGGHVGGDKLEFRFEIAKDSKALITTQGATKIYKSIDESVCSSMDISIAENGTFEFVPDPIIPFANSSYVQNVNVEMHENAKFLYAETLYQGRAASGESFDYTLLELRLKVRMNGIPILTDSLMIKPQDSNIGNEGLFESYPFLGSFYIIGETRKNLLSITTEADTLLSDKEEIIGGSTIFLDKGVMIRFLSKSAISLREYYYNLWNISRKILLKKESILLRKL